MVNIILGISLTLNLIFLIYIYFYVKYKVLGIRKLKKDLEKQFVKDDEFDDMLERL